MVAGPLAHYSLADTGSLTVVSNKLSQIDDLSGNGHHVTQGTAGSRPLYDATPRTINGITCAEFTGAGEFMESTCPMDDRTFSVFAVVMLDTAAGNKCIVGDTQGGGFEIRIAGTVVQHLKSGVAVLGASTLAIPVSVPLAYCSRMDASTHYFNWFGDTQQTASDSSTFTAGRTLRLGLDTSSTIAWNGLIAEVIVYSTLLTLTEVSQNFAYLAGVWA